MLRIVVELLAIVHYSSFHHLSHNMNSIVLSLTQPRRCKYKIWAQLPISMDNGYGPSIHFITSGQFHQIYFLKLLSCIHHCSGQELVLYIYRNQEKFSTFTFTSNQKTILTASKEIILAFYIKNKKIFYFINR